MIFILSVKSQLMSKVVVSCTTKLGFGFIVRDSATLFSYKNIRFH